MSQHRDRREALGAYVLGALEPDERREVEAHLEECSACRDELARLSVLPSLLEHLSPEEARDASLIPSPALATRLTATTLEEGHRLRRQLRGWRVATSVAAAAAVALLVAWAPWTSPAEPDRWVLRPVTARAGVDGTAAALAWEWGTTVELHLEDLPPADRYVVVTVAEDGRREQAGTWGRTTSGDAYVRGASAIQRHDLAEIEVAQADGPVLATFEVSPPA